MRRACLASLPVLILAAGCAKPPKPAAPAAQAPPAPQPQPTREYVDLEAGWRLKIIAPVTKSGAYQVLEPQPAESSGNVIALKASSDLIGYETALWSIEGRRSGGGGVSLRLDSVEMTTDGKAAPIPAPTRALVHVPGYARFLRIFYLTRKSDADHNMALTGVGRKNQIDALTRALREDPSTACASRPHERVYCEWIPAGMAVRPEVPKTENGVTRWVDRF